MSCQDVMEQGPHMRDLDEMQARGWVVRVRLTETATVRLPPVQ